MAKVANLILRVTSETGQAQAGLGRVSGSASKFQAGMAKANKAALAVAAGLAVVGAASFKQASDLQQAAGAVDSVFGKQADAVHKLAKSAADSFGLSRAEYSQTAAVFGAQLRNMGVSAKQLVPQTDKLISLGGDLAATFGGKTSDAVEALSALLRGERDPIEKYGVSIKQADINARLAAKGQDKLTGAARKSAETQATLELLYQQTAKAQGQRSREAHTAAVRQEVALAKIKNAGAALGRVLLPVFASVASAIAKTAGYVERNSTAFLVLAGVAGTLAGAVIAINAAYKAYLAITTAVKVAQWALNAAMAANPIGLIVAAVIAAVAAMVLLYKRSQTVRTIVNAVGKAGQKAIGWLVDRVKDAWRWVQKLGPVFNKAKSIGVAAFKAITTPQRLIVNLLMKVFQWAASKLPAAWNKAKSIGVAAFRALTSPIRTVISIIGNFAGKAVNAFRKIVGPVQAVANKVWDLIGAIRSIKWPSPPSWLSKIGGAIGGLLRAAPPATGGARYARVPALRAQRPAVSRAPALRTGVRDQGGVTIIIQGAVDPISTARQVRRLLVRGSLAAGTVAR